MEKQKPRASWNDEPDPWCPQLTVYESEGGETDTGLLGPDGTKIMRRASRGPIGFDLTRGKR